MTEHRGHMVTVTRIFTRSFQIRALHQGASERVLCVNILLIYEEVFIVLCVTLAANWMIVET